MPRAPRARQPDVAERIRLFAEHHIVAVRTGRRNGEIIAVKHATMGWITPQAYYGLEKMHEFLPIVEKVIEGGYRVNAMIWGFNPTIGVGGVGIPVPAGAALLGISAYNLSIELTALEHGAPRWERLLEVAWQVFGPFGAVLSLVEQIKNASAAAVNDLCTLLYNAFHDIAVAENIYEQAYGAELVSRVVQLQGLLKEAQAQGCSWAQGATTWRDVKL